MTWRLTELEYQPSPAETCDRQAEKIPDSATTAASGDFSMGDFSMSRFRLRLKFRKGFVGMTTRRLLPDVPSSDPRTREYKAFPQRYLSEL